MRDDGTLEAAVLDIGRQLADALPSASRHPGKALDDKAMELAAQDRELRTALFRLVDVVPACRGLDDLARHLTGFLSELDEPPGPVGLALRMGDSRAGRLALGTATAAGVRRMAHRFIVGDSPDAALPMLSRLWSHGVASSVDLLGEATVTPAEADAYAARCAAALDTLATQTRRWPARPTIGSR